MELKDTSNFHQSENVDTKKIVQQMMPTLYDYIMDVELSVNPNTPRKLVDNNKYSLYFHNNPNHRHSLLDKVILLERIEDELVTYKNAVAGI